MEGARRLRLRDAEELPPSRRSTTRTCRRRIPARRGPENVVARLSVAWDHITRQDQTTHHIAADGDVVFLDHTEKWTFKTGETCEHRFCTMHELRDGKIVQWSDFWDVSNFVGQFPEWFLQEMAKKQGADFGA